MPLRAGAMRHRSGSAVTCDDRPEAFSGAHRCLDEPVTTVTSMTCWDDSMRLAPVVAAAAAVANLLLLALLHVLPSEVDPLTRPVSEYALGDLGWLAATRTVVEGVGVIALAVSLLLERAAAQRLQRVAALILLVVG